MLYGLGRQSGIIERRIFSGRRVNHNVILLEANKSFAPSAIGWTLLSLIAANHAAEKPSAYRAPRLPDGHVDLQGMWRNSNLTPLERPADFSQLAISAADAKRLKEQYLSPSGSQNQPDDPDQRPDLLHSPLDWRNTSAALDEENVRVRLPRGQLFDAGCAGSHACAGRERINGGSAGHRQVMERRILASLRTGRADLGASPFRHRRIPAAMPHGSFSHGLWRRADGVATCALILNGQSV